LLAQEQRDRLVRQGERIGDAVYTAVAVNDPKRLQTIGRDYEQSIGLGTDTVTSDPNFIEKAKAWMLNGEQIMGSPEPQPGGID
jgi:hypothetical protein